MRMRNSRQPLNEEGLNVNPNALMMGHNYL